MRVEGEIERCKLRYGYHPGGGFGSVAKEVKKCGDEGQFCPEGKRLFNSMMRAANAWKRNNKAGARTKYAQAIQDFKDHLMAEDALNMLEM